MTYKTVSKERQRELFKQMLDRHRRNTHHMGSDVPYWIEDILNASDGILNGAWRGARFGAVLILIVLALYEIYAVLNGLPRPTGHQTIKFLVFFVISGVFVGIVSSSFHGPSK